MKQMIAAFLEGPKRVELKQVPVPEPKENQILVRIRAVGVCGSDVHYYQHGRMGPFAPTEPLVLGHESAGEVVACGSSVQGFAAGDRVALEPGIPCGSCEPCKRGRYNLCPSVYFMGSAPNQHGAFREYVAWDPRMAYRLPDAVGFEEGALLEPLAAASYAVRLGGVAPGQSVAVFGCGPIGLLIARMARISGAAQVFVSDVDPARLEKAHAFGATLTVDARSADFPADVRAATGGEGADVVFEAAGAPVSHQKSLETAARGGTVVFVGWLANGDLSLDLHAIGTRELTVRGMFRYRNVYPESIRLLSSGQVDLKALITGRYPLSRVVDALQEALARKPGTLKIMIDAGGQSR
jgi:L-iditol 2-dehydrogenase